MSHLKIENNSVCPVEGFTVLGLSTARDNDAAIGQFGSGNKQAILLLLRLGIKPVVCCGKDRLTFYTKSALMKDAQGNQKQYQEVWYSHGQKNTKTSCCLDYGIADWDNVTMAVREFVSNAIDQSVQSDKGTWSVDIVEDKQVRCKDGTTRVFIPMDDNGKVQACYDALPTMFLHFSGKNKQRFIPKTEEGQARIYRKGVYVRTISRYYKPSLFDYNFGDELPIDEARNIDDYQCFRAAGSAISTNRKAVQAVLQASLDNREVWELQIPSYYFDAESNKDIWASAWYNVAGDAVVASTDHSQQRAERKGFAAKRISCEALYKNLETVVKTADAELSPLEQLGYNELPATDKAISNAKRTWTMLQDIDMVAKDKEPPKVKCFSKTMDAGSQLFGFAKGDTVFINVDNDDSRSTMLEEIGHYITGASDETRDFQDFAFTVAGRMAELYN